MIRALKFLFALTSLLFVLACTEYSGRVILVNKSSDIISQATVSICDQVMKFYDINPNNSKEDGYRVRSDSHYLIEVKFKSGKTIKRETGYVTNGMNVYHKITITDNDLTITDAKILK